MLYWVYCEFNVFHILLPGTLLLRPASIQGTGDESGLYAVTPIINILRKNPVIWSGGVCKIEIPPVAVYRMR